MKQEILVRNMYFLKRGISPDMSKNVLIKMFLDEISRPPKPLRVVIQIQVCGDTSPVSAELR